MVKTKKRISSEVLKRIKENPELIAKLQIETERSYPTIMRWIRVGSDQLTKSYCLDLICKELRLPKSSVLTN